MQATKIETIINHKTIGDGKWPFENILKYCYEKGIVLESASYIESEPGVGARSYHLDIATGATSHITGCSAAKKE